MKTHLCSSVDFVAFLLVFDAAVVVVDAVVFSFIPVVVVVAINIKWQIDDNVVCNTKSNHNKQEFLFHIIKTLEQLN